MTPPIQMICFYSIFSKELELELFAQGKIDGLVKSPSAALRFNPALLDKNLRF
jgi:hypothetical protein